MEPLRICLSTQTPLLQFTGPRSRRHLFGPFNGTSDLTGLVEGVDYRYSPGGVTRMVLPLVERLRAEGVIAEAHWVSLNPAGPPTVRLPGLFLHNISLPGARLASYGVTKEVIWGTIHGTTATAAAEEMFWTDAFSEYAYYNRRTAERIRELDRRLDFDLFYVHDFQQLPLGGMLGTLKPKVLRWHIPFDSGTIPELWRDRLGAYLDSYDAIVVSSRQYEDALRSFGHHGRIVRMFPYVDPAQYSHPSPTQAVEVGERLGIAPDDRVILVVARMDPMKGQDRALAAFASVARRRRDVRLVFVGNGSFSSSKGGLGLSKADRWRAHLAGLAEELGVAERVTFTGHVSQGELDALYERALFTVLPSVQEGFGLVVVESWLHGRATVVSRRAGIAELLRSGRNGILVDPEDPAGIARAMADLLDHPARRRALAAAGRRTARRCTVAAVAEAETRLFAELLGG